MSSATTAGRHVDANGASLYVEEHGEGDPLILVHGAGVSSAMWAPMVPLLADRFRVVTFDIRGHGRSENPSGALSYPLVADDTAALIESLGIERPVICGWSDGGQAVLEIGMRHPGVARALIAGGVKHNYQEPEFQVWRDFLCVDEHGVVDVATFEARDPQFAQYLIAMHPRSMDQLAPLLQQTADQWRAYPSLTREKLSEVTTPTLVISGDRDGLIPLQHTIDIFEWLTNAELAILPGANHVSAFMQPAVFVAVAVDYIARH